MRLLKHLIPTRETKDAPTRRHSASTTHITTGTPITPTFDAITADTAVKEAWAKSIWVYRAENARSKAMAAIRMVVRETREDGAPPIKDHPLLGLFNSKPNPYESSYDFRYRLTTLLDLSVDTGVPVEVIEDRTGTPTALHILNPIWCRPVPDADTFLAGWEMRLPSGELFTAEDLPPYVRGKGSGVIWFKRPHPTDPYRSHSWLTSAGITIDLDWYTRVYARNFVLNDGRPSGVLLAKNEGGIDPIVAETLKRRIQPGPENAGRVELFEADELQWVDLSGQIREAGYQETRRLTKEEILLASGVPESVAGNASGRCLRASEWVRLADGSRRRAGDLVGETFDVLTYVDGVQQVVSAFATAEAHETIYRVTTESGRTLETNGRHPLYAASHTSTKAARWRSENGPRIDLAGWTGVAALPVGSLVAVPAVFAHVPSDDLSPEEAFVVGSLVGDGSISNTRAPVLLTTPDGEFVKEFTRSVEALGDEVTRVKTGDRVAAWSVRAPVTAHVRDQHGHCSCQDCRDVAARNARNRRAGIPNAAPGRPARQGAVRTLLWTCGLVNVTSHTKFVPNRVFAARPAAQAAFISGLYAADGHVSKRTIELSTCNHRLALEVQELLLRLGVPSRVRAKSRKGGLPSMGDRVFHSWVVDVATADGVVAFCEMVQIPGKQDALDALAVLHGQVARARTWRTKGLPAGLQWEKVTSVDVIGDDDTVGIGVPTHHTYLSTFYEHNTFNNAEAEEEGWWVQELVPELKAIANVWDQLTDDPDSETEVVSYDWDSVEVLQRAARAREERAIERFAKSAITLDDLREELGYERLNVPGTRVLWLPAGMSPIGADADVIALLSQGQQPPQELAPPVEPPSGSAVQLPDPVDVLDEGVYGDRLAITAPPPQAPQPEPVAAEPAVKAMPQGDVPAKYLAAVRLAAWTLADEQETLVARELRSLFTRQEAVVLARLRGPQAKQHTRHWVPTKPATRPLELKALDAGYVVDRARWAVEVVAAITGVVTGAVLAAARATVTQLQGGLQATGTTGQDRSYGKPAGRTPTSRGFTVPDVDVFQPVVERVVALITEGFDNRTGKLQDIITAADQAGDSLDEIADKVTKAYMSADTWAATQARTVVGAMNAARVITAAQAGAVARRWVATDDPRTRPTHAAAEGQVVDMRSPFTVGAALLMFPGDPSGPIEEIVNCRCSLMFRLPENTPDRVDADLDADLADLSELEETGESAWKQLEARLETQTRRVPSQLS